MEGMFGRLKRKFKRERSPETPAIQSSEEGLSEHIRQAQYVLKGEFREEMKLASDPNRYLGLPAHKEDFIVDSPLFKENDGSRLMYMYRRVLRLTGNPERAKDFAKMVLAMPNLAPSGVVQAVYALAFRDFQYTQELARRIEGAGSPLTAEEWHRIEEIVSEPGAFFQAISLNELAKGRNDTEEIKANFRGVLQKHRIVLE